MMKQSMLFTVLCFLILSSCSGDFELDKESPTSTLWYDKPASVFEESLLIGNGQIGATIFGGVSNEKIYLNDATLWSGEPRSGYDTITAFKEIPKIREMLRNEDYNQANKLNRRFQGHFSASYAPLGTLYLEFPNQNSYQNYYRDLNVENAISRVYYEVDGVKFQRDYFISYPDQMMVIRIKTNEKEALNFDVRFDSQLRYSTTSSSDDLIVDGYAPYFAAPAYRKNVVDPIRFDPDRGIHFATILNMHKCDGSINVKDTTLSVRNATTAELRVSIATSFNGYDKDPVLEGKPYKENAIQKLEAAKSKGYREIRKNHIDDFSSYMNRVSLSLGENTVPNEPIDVRLKAYAKGAEDPNLESLYFQFGRYLMISSSRTPEVPANLQGIWNHMIRPPWSSNYTLNINTQENYWLAESGNLSEFHQPLLSFIKNIASSGEVTAKRFYGINEGWTSCHNSDIWAISNAVGGFGQGDPRWASWNMSGPWLATHLWNHFEYTQNLEYLRKDAYPLLKGSALFCLKWMVKDKNGNWITSPSTSPENVFVTDKGFVGATLYGATADLAIIRECLIQTREAARTLGIDKEFQDCITSVLENMYPYQIGQDGSLQEWYHDWKDKNPLHRHQSHLYGLFPGNHITVDESPEIAKACAKALEIKGDETTGWSKGWRFNLWARLHDGERAYKMYRELLRYTEPGSKNKGGTYPNLLDAHPPFQIDGNFGGAAGVIEMLMQSNNEQITLLPSLPKAWSCGTVKGICARGGITIDMSWKDGKVTLLKGTSKINRDVTFVFNGENKTLSLRKGETTSIL
ncbi:glycoside hydrolase family 95 protein [Halosquirtibacter xylanolyticus]|uniref:glycoside hydrolase family 95 protein n=1 Tax=Halosquirtibacter xylanolyticus TaxID=3374599 RepID=UPI00374A22F9|nr:glycoside hydrolase family 95 protein [Prolixibacteraceae bacterium]